MSTHLDLVEQFHAAFKYRYPSPTEPDFDEQTISLRITLLREELQGENELWDSVTKQNRVGVLDGLCDLQYVLSGAVLALGLKSLFVERMADASPRHGLYAASSELQAQLVLNMIDAAITRLWVMLEAGADSAAVESLVLIQQHIRRMVALMGFTRFEEAFAAVHARNMAKLWTQSQASEYMIATNMRGPIVTFEQSGDRYIARRSDGKIAKPPGFVAPDLTQYI